MRSAVEPPDFDCPPQANLAAVERDMRMVCEAIELVASGAAARVVIANIRFGSVVLDPARRLALDRGLRIRPRWRRDMEADLVGEPISP